MFHLIKGLSLTLEEASKKGFVPSISEEGCSIKSYIGTDENVVVPQFIEGELVTTIQAGAFKGCKAESVEVPFGVTCIEKYAFSSKMLKKVILPTTAIKIDALAFEGVNKHFVIAANLGSHALRYSVKAGITSISSGSGSLFDELRALTEVADNVIVLDDEPFIVLKSSLKGVSSLVSVLSLAGSDPEENVGIYERYRKGNGIVMSGPVLKLRTYETLTQLLKNMSIYISFISNAKVSCKKCKKAKYPNLVVPCKKCLGIYHNEAQPVREMVQVSLALEVELWERLQNVSRGNPKKYILDLVENNLQSETIK